MSARGQNEAPSPAARPGDRTEWRVLRNIGLLLGLVVAGAMVILFEMARRHQAAHDLALQAMDYHLFTVLRCNAIERELDAVTLRMSRDARLPRPPGLLPPARQAIEHAKTLVAREFGAIEKRQAVYAAGAFTPALEVVRRSVREFEAINTGEAAPAPTEVVQIINRFRQALGELGSQHLGAHERLVGGFARDEASEELLFFVGLVAGATLLTGAVVAWLTWWLLTERRADAERLRASEERRRTIFLTEPECIKLLNERCELMEMNPAGLELIEADSFDAVRGHNVLPIVAPEDRDAFAQLNERVFRGESGKLEFEIIGLRGTRRRVETHAVPLRDRGGKVTAALGITRDVTGRRQAEAALAAERNLLRTLIDAVPEHIYVKDPAGRFLVVNEAHRRMLMALNPQEPVGHTVRDYFPPEIAAGFEQDDRRILEGGEPIIGREEPCVTGSGERRFYLTSKAPLRAPDGKITGLVGISRDITELKRAEEALRTSEELFRTLATVSPIGIFRTDAAGRCVYVNPRWSEISGYPLEAALGDGWRRALHPEDAPRRLTVWDASLAAGQFPAQEYRYLRPDGREVWVVTQVMPTRDAQGAVTGWVGAVMDVTERHQAEAEVRRSLESLQVLIDSLPAYISFVDATERYVVVNRRYEDWFGRPAGELIGRRLEEIHPPEVYAEMRPHVRRVLAGEPVFYERHLPDVSGTFRWLEVRYVPRVEAGGKVTGFFALVFDVTESRQAAQALRRSEELLRRAQAVARVGSWELDVRSNRLEWSDETLRMFGVSRQEGLNYDRFLACVHPEDRERVDRAWKAALAGAPYNIEHRICANGETRWVVERAEVTFDEARQPVRAVGTVQDITELKRVELALREAQQRLQDILASLDVVLWSASVDGQTVLYISPSAERLYGRPAADFYANPRLWLEFVHPDDRSRVEQSMREMIQSGLDTGGYYSMEYRFHRADGQLRWMRDTGRIVRDAAGRPVRLDGIATDITGQRRAEVERERLAAILQATSDLVGLADAQGRALYINPAGRRLLGIPADKDVSGVDIRTYHPPWAERKVLEEGIPRAIREGSWSGETALWGADGREVPVSQVILAHVGADGKPECLSTIARDISERLAIEKALRERERAHASLIANLSGMVYRCRNDAQWTMEFVGGQCEAITGYTPEQLRDNREVAFGDLVHPEDAGPLWEKCQANLAARRACSNEYRIRTARGEWIWVWDQAQGVYAEDGSLIAIEGIISDITERRRLEAEMRALNETLESRVRERTAELSAANAELARRAQELEALNRELEAFSYSVSHDLRAPLRSIDGFSQALVEDCGPRLDEQGRAHLQRVRAATQRMAGLIDDLLELSRLSRAELERQPVDLSSLAAEVTAELRAAEPRRNVETIIAPGLTGRGDPRLLRLVLENLLENAWKFTRQRDDARVEFGAMEADGQRAFFVRDNGAGFDTAYAHKMFGAFQRLHSQSEFEGSGIGLATVQRIIHRHGGRVWARGVVGQGAVFHFTLPD
jgi:PAS domain S-box-containing protein